MTAWHGQVRTLEMTIGSPARSAVGAAGELRTLLLALDTLDHCLAFYDHMGRLLHGSRAYLMELEAIEDAESLRRDISQFAQAISALAAVAQTGAAVQQFGKNHVSGSRGVYELQGTFVGVNLFGRGSTVLVAVTPPAPDPFAAERLRRRFDMTRAQARVARFLASGLRNDEIAQRLCISSHTVRHHVERIRMKVGGHTRAAVAARLREET
jgi:DNA-binding CsgD family transcriptional regulator